MSEQFKRPESILVVIYTQAGEVLLMERTQPPGYWQSVTGSLRWDEQEPRVAALREVREETGLVVDELLVDSGYQNRFEILPAWRHLFAPDVDSNVEHVFRVELPEQAAVTLNPEEHSQYSWLPAKVAALQASSYTNQAAIERLMLRR
jgi:dATP pyrophosphohydrolase